MSPYTALSALSPNSDGSSLLVRVGRVWEAINKKTNTLLHTNMILLDEEENHMLAVIRNNQKDIFLPMLSEGGIFCISNVKIVPGPTLYRSVDRDLSINFFYKTKIAKRDDTNMIPRYKFELQPFDNVKNLVGNVKCLIDVVGMVTSYGQTEKRSNGAAKMDVLLSNSRKEKLVVTLWEDKAAQFQASLAEAHNSAIFVVITGLLAKQFSGCPSLSSTDATRSYFNIDYAPLIALKKEFLAASNDTVETLPLPTMTQFVNVDENNAQELSIQSIFEVKIPTGKELVRCTCKGRIVDVLNGNGWFYNCCPKCARTVRLLEGKYFCNTCAEEAPTFTQRYRVVVRVEDTSGTTTFTLFNKEAEQLIGVPVQKVLSEMEENASSAHIPAVVKNIIGKMCAFQIKVTWYNIKHGCEEYTVTRVSEVSTTPIDKGGDESSSNFSKKQKCA